MTVAQFLIAMFALLIAGLMLPLPYGARMALFLVLTTLAVLTAYRRRHAFSDRQFPLGAAPLARIDVNRDAPPRAGALATRSGIL
jgi:hypothetical protein